MKDKSIEELQEKVTINEMIDVLLLDQLNAIYQQHGSQSNYYAEIRDRTRFALLNRFRELQEYKDAFEKLWEYCVDEAKHKTKLVKRISELEKEVENWKEFAKQESINKDYYIGLLDEIAKVFGDKSYISDDGSVQDSPLRAKMPELVEELKTAYQDMGVERDNALVAYNNLKCCGNCRNHYRPDLAEPCKTRFDFGYCDNWKSDGLTKTGRSERK